MAEQNRGNLAHFVAKTAAGPFDRIAKGVSTMGAALNPQSETRTYIDDSSSTTTTAYQAEWAIDGSIYSGDPASDMLHEMAVQRVKGDDAIVYMINVFTWKDGTAAGSFQAYRQECNWAPASDGGGDGGTDVTFSGSLTAKGDPIYGEAVITKDEDTGFETCTFTPVAIPDDATLVANAKAAIGALTFGPIEQASYADQAAVKTYVQAQIATVNLAGVTATITGETYTAPVAGDSGTPAGTDGSYQFSVSLTKGAASDTSGPTTLVITATPNA